MPVYSIWESKFPPEIARAGVEVTEAIWKDMFDFDGYLSHELLVDADDAGHLVVVSQWASRDDADEALRKYRGHPNAERADQLASEPRRRIVAIRESGNAT